MAEHDAASEWLSQDRDPDTCKQINDLVRSNNVKELSSRLQTGRIRFGTAGLRAEMGAGWNRMNSLIVAQTSRGLADYIQSKFESEEAKSRGVVIGRDARHNSFKFAKLTAAAFVDAGFKVYWFNDVVPTPLVPYTVREKRAVAGIMVTASHNPAKDNGYKVYWANACQIVAPHDQGIAAAIEASCKDKQSWEVNLDAFLVDRIDSSSNTFKKYITSILDVAALKEPLPKFVYTPMHGVGKSTFERVVKSLALGRAASSADPELPHDAYRVVSVQADPDPDFPTVEFPNPEENGALDIATAVADQSGSTLILANDPDADRLAVMVGEVGSNGTVWHKLTGNQLGCLLASYALDCYRERPTSQQGKLAMLASTVSSGMLREMARQEGFHFEETLTGFKWLGNVAQQLEEKGYDAVFAYEEALGYMFTAVGHDKDGITAGAAFLAAATRWAKEGLTPWQKLLQLYSKYGFFAEANTYVRSPNSSVTKGAFDRIRRSKPEGSDYPRRLGKYDITAWRDLSPDTAMDSTTIDKVPVLPVEPNTQMITCHMSESGGQTVRFTVRASGTEPKIKFYVDCRSTESMQKAHDEAVAVNKLIQEEWFPPEVLRAQ